MRIAWFSPLPPAPSGVADYAADFLPYLMCAADVEVFTGDRRSRLHDPRWAVWQVEEWPERDRKKHFQCCLYHIGNNPLHISIFEQAVQRPGIAVLHDAVLQHLHLGVSRAAWESEFVHHYGERGREIAHNLAGGNAAAHEGFFRYPLVGRVARASRLVMVHNPGAEERVRREAPEAVIRRLPLPFVRRCGPFTPEAARRELAIAPGAFLIGCFGYLRETRRLPVALRVFERLRDRVKHAEMIVVGSFCTPELASLMLPRFAALGVRYLGHVTDAEFEQYATACDAVINLRYPSAGETSAVTVRTMGLGAVVALTESAENSPFPEDACLRIPPDESEEPLLLEYLLALAGNARLGRAIGAKARSYIEQEHDPENCVRALLEALRSVT